MPKVSEEHLIAKQEQILQAATRCFALNGFHATGMAEIIRESGLSAGSVYRYYKGKDDLIAAVVERMVGEMETQLVQAAEQATTLTEAVSACLQLAFQIRSKNDDLGIRLLPQVWTEALRNPVIGELVSNKYTTILTHFTELVRRLQQAGTANNALEPEGVASVLLSLIQGYGLQKLILHREINDQLYLQAATELLDQ